MRLYLAYCDLILIFKIDFIALTITSQLISASTHPFKFIICYSVLAIGIHLPSMIIRRSKDKYK